MHTGGRRAGAESPRGLGVVAGGRTWVSFSGGAGRRRVKSLKSLMISWVVNETLDDEGIVGTRERAGHGGPKIAGSIHAGRMPDDWGRGKRGVNAGRKLVAAGGKRMTNGEYRVANDARRGAGLATKDARPPVKRSTQGTQAEWKTRNRQSESPAVSVPEEMCIVFPDCPDFAMIVNRGGLPNSPLKKGTGTSREGVLTGAERVGFGASLFQRAATDTAGAYSAVRQTG